MAVAVDEEEAMVVDEEDAMAVDEEDAMAVDEEDVMPQGKLVLENELVQRERPMGLCPHQGNSKEEKRLLYLHNL